MGESVCSDEQGLPRIRFMLVFYLQVTAQNCHERGLRETVDGRGRDERAH